VSAGLAGTFVAGVTSARDLEMKDWESPFVAVSGPATDPLVDGTAQFTFGITGAGIAGYLVPHLG
jgi:hypothetical protein